MIQVRPWEMQNIDKLLPKFAYPNPVIESMLDGMTRKGVSTSQIPALLKASCDHLDTLVSRLDELCQSVPEDSTLLHDLSSLKSCFHSSEDFTLQKAASWLADLQSLTAETNPSSSATLRECQALISAAMQNHLSGAEFCHLASETPGIEILQKWRLSHLEAMLLGDHGREFGDETALQNAIDLLRNQVLILARQHTLEEQQLVTLETLGRFLGVIGQRRSGTRYLEESIQAYQKALELCRPGSFPATWSAVQNGLGNALGALGQRQSDDDQCEMAIKAFEEALRFRTEEKTPDDWASTLNNMAAVLHSLGRKNKDPKILKRAVDTYKEILRIWTKSDAPIDWATTMFNLGTALGSLGEHRRGPRTLEQAVAAYNSALSIRSHDLLPEQWAVTHNNLGTALQKLAERQDSAEIMQRAVEAYENTLDIWTQEIMPMSWAMSMANLGVARRSLAAMSGNVESAERAVNDIKSAVKIFRSASHAKYTELGEEQLSLARQQLTQLIVGDDSGTR
ncbi:MAG: tetratricopeptide repeat protein [Gammaproteobacteria bacterium]|nr:tetratricopeptide repeat protein [Gammaproteobacteria bacterium]MYJ52802.1 tetratricopeptide repeat protein [Gammaproteobacteria bacterium]